MTRSVSRRIVLATGLTLPVTTAWARPEERGFMRPAKEPDFHRMNFTIPEPTGRYEVGTVELHLVDRDRQDRTMPSGHRELMVSLWYPAMPGGPDGPLAGYMPPLTADHLDGVWSDEFYFQEKLLDFAGTVTHARVGAPVRIGRRPILLYSPGHPFSRFVNTQLVEDLASRGYIVVTVDHTGETPVEFPGGRFVPGVPMNEPPVPARMAEFISTRVADLRFVLSRLDRIADSDNPDAAQRRLPDGLKTSLDLRRVGVFGFAHGGYAAAATMLADSRFRAGLDLDGTLADTKVSGPIGEVAQRGLDRPFVLFGSDANQREDPKLDSYNASWAAFWEAQRGWKLNLQLAGGQHLGFTDFQFVFDQLLHGVYGDDELVTLALNRLIGKVDFDRSRQAQRDYLDAYFTQTLRGLPQHLLRGESSTHPDVRFVP